MANTKITSTTKFRRCAMRHDPVAERRNRVRRGVKKNLGITPEVSKAFGAPERDASRARVNRLAEIVLDRLGWGGAIESLGDRAERCTI